MINRLPYLDYIATILLNRLSEAGLPAPARGVAINQRDNVIQLRGVSPAHRDVIDAFLSDAPLAPDASAWASAITGTMSVDVRVTFECELWPESPYESHYHVSVQPQTPPPASPFLLLGL